MNTFKFKKLDPRLIAHDKMCVFIGKRGMGKTTLMKDILSFKASELTAGIIFSPTEDANGTWSEHLSPLYIHAEFEQHKLQSLLDRQIKIAKMLTKKLNNKYKKTNSSEFEEAERKKKINEELKKLIPKVFVVMEDCGYDEAIKKSKALRYLFMNGRHLNIFLLMSLQYLLDITPGLRGQIDYIFFGKENNPNVKKKLFQHYFGMFPSYKLFDKAFTKFTSDRGCMVINTTAVSNNIVENVFYYKASPNKRFKLGNKYFIEFADKHYNPHYDSEEEEDDNATNVNIDTNCDFEIGEQMGA